MRPTQKTTFEGSNQQSSFETVVIHWAYILRAFSYLAVKPKLVLS